MSRLPDCDVLEVDVSQGFGFWFALRLAKESLCRSQAGGSPGKRSTTNHPAKQQMIILMRKMDDF